MERRRSLTSPSSPSPDSTAAMFRLTTPSDAVGAGQTVEDAEQPTPHCQPEGFSTMPSPNVHNTTPTGNNSTLSSQLEQLPFTSFTPQLPSVLGEVLPFLDVLTVRCLERAQVWQDSLDPTRRQVGERVCAYPLHIVPTPLTRVYEVQERLWWHIEVYVDTYMLFLWTLDVPATLVRSVATAEELGRYVDPILERILTDANSAGNTPPINHPSELSGIPCDSQPVDRPSGLIGIVRAPQPRSRPSTRDDYGGYRAFIRRIECQSS
jgi:hypothetical protein